MNYKMQVVIYNPETPKGMDSDIVKNLTATFVKDTDTYGNKHYVDITDGQAFDKYYDIRYDKSFRSNNKEQWLEDWARGYWPGKNGAYAVKSIEISKVVG